MEEEKLLQNNKNRIVDLRSRWMLFILDFSISISVDY